MTNVWINSKIAIRRCYKNIGFKYFRIFQNTFVLYIYVKVTGLAKSSLSKLKPTTDIFLRISCHSHFAYIFFHGTSWEPVMWSLSEVNFFNLVTASSTQQNNSCGENNTRVERGAGYLFGERPFSRYCNKLKSVIGPLIG